MEERSRGRELVMLLFLAKLVFIFTVVWWMSLMLVVGVGVKLCLTLNYLLSLLFPLISQAVQISWHPRVQPGNFPIIRLIYLWCFDHQILRVIFSLTRVAGKGKKYLKFWFKMFYISSICCASIAILRLLTSC